MERRNAEKAGNRWRGRGVVTPAIAKWRDPDFAFASPALIHAFPPHPSALSSNSAFSSLPPIKTFSTIAGATRRNCEKPMLASG